MKLLTIKKPVTLATGLLLVLPFWICNSRCSAGLVIGLSLLQHFARSLAVIHLSWY